MSETNGVPELPRGWVWTSIGEIAATGSGGTPSRGRTDYYGGSIPWVKSGELKDRTVFQSEEFITELGLHSSSAKIFPAGTLCIALYGATVGKLGILGIDAATNQAVCGIFVPPVIVTQYLFHFLSWQRRNLIELGKGGAQPNISQEIVRRTVIPIPPLPEQQRIVSKIEELFTELDAGVESLKKARTQLKRYRQAVLKAAVTGELTREWRAAHRGELEPAADLLARILRERRAKWEADQLAKMRAAGKPPKNDDWKTRYQEPVAPDTSEAPELPEGWIWTNIQQVGEVSGGLTKNQKREKLPLKLPYLRVANVYAGELDLAEVKNIGVEEGELERVLLAVGDLLVVEGNGSIDQIGRVALWDGGIEPCLHQNHLIKVRFNPVQLGDYILWWLLSREGRDFITKAASSTSGLHTLSLSKVAGLPIPFPPLREQQQIVSEVERLLSIADATERTIEQSLRQAERLRQSVLRRAFAGELVPQDPADEPASALLERIRRERDARADDRPRKQRRRKSKGVTAQAAADRLFS
jgi:type I restriction enzyme, S subunit